MTALHLAAREGYPQVVRFLLVSGADLTIMDNEGRTARALAISRTSSEIAGCQIDFKVSQRMYGPD
jgi:ankyrin repeat protein